jgi:hypothetical protein
VCDKGTQWIIKIMYLAKKRKTQKGMKKKGNSPDAGLFMLF